MSNRIGRYEIRSRLGSGAFATVFEAFDPRLESTVAIKLLADNWIHEPDVRARFRQEAVLLRRVQTAHPNAPLLDVYDIDETDDGRPYFVMRLADRGSLAERSAPGQKWPAREIIAIVDMVEAALTPLHQAGIVHRDVKPSNLLVTTSGEEGVRDDEALIMPGERILLGDLGLAKDQLLDGSALTVAGGTPRYMAPEQRDPAATIDRRADLYAATVLVVDLLTGTPAVPDASSGLQHQALALIRIGMAENPSDRFSDARSWAAAMRSVLQPPRTAVVDEPTPPRRPTTQTVDAPPPQAPRQAARRSPVDASDVRIKIAAAAVALALIVGAVAFALTRSSDGDIVGPRTASVGQAIQLSAEVDPGDRYVWMVGGREVADEDLTLSSDEPGFIDVQLVVTANDGSTRQSSAKVTVSE